MEGERSVISLDSQLDINSNDMLVPIQSSKFAHNRQRHLGSLLQSSVRYESDGWMAGWNGHRFDYLSTRNDYAEPPLFDNAKLQVFNKTDATTGTTYYLVLHKDIALQYTFVPATYAQWTTGGGTVNRANDAEINVTGTTVLGSTFTCKVDPYTGEVLDFVSNDAALQPKLNRSGILFSLTVDRELVIGLDDQITIRVGESLQVSDNTLLAYSKAGATSNWGGVFNLTDANVFTITGTEFIISSPVNVANAGTVNETATIHVKDTTPLTLSSSFNYISKWVRDTFVNATVAIAGPAMTSIDTPANKQTAELLWNHDADGSYNNRGVARYSLPIWIQHKIRFLYSIVFQTSANPVVLPSMVITYKFTGLTEELTFADFNFTATTYIDESLEITEEMFAVVDANNYTLTITDFPRYTEIGVYLPDVVEATEATEAVEGSPGKLVSQRRLYAQDWDRVSEYWSSYYGTVHPNIPITSNDDVPRQLMPTDDPPYDGLVTCTISQSPDPYLLEQPIDPDDDEYDPLAVNRPKDALRRTAPPYEAPGSGTLNVAFDTANQFSSIMGVVNGIDAVGCRWEWDFQIKRRFGYVNRRNIRSLSQSVRYLNAAGVITAGPPISRTWHACDGTSNLSVIVNDDLAPYSFAVKGITKAELNAILATRVPGKTYMKDEWILYLRCVSTNTSYPIPVDSPYFTLEIPCTGNFKDTVDFMDLVDKTVPVQSIRTVKIPHYTDGMYADDYKVLNDVSTTDKDIWGYQDADDRRNGMAMVNIPLAIPGWSVVDFQTPNLIESGKDSFNATVISNAELQTITGLSRRMWRIDNTAGGLGLVAGFYANVQGQDNDPVKKIHMVYDTTGKPFYNLKQVPVNSDSATGSILSYMDGAFPAWIKSGTSAMGLSNATCETYYPSSDNMTAFDMNALIKSGNFIASNSVVTDKTYTQTDYNIDLFNNVYTVLIASLPAAANYMQSVQVMLDPNNYTQFTYDPVLGIISAISDVYPDYEAVGTSTIGHTPQLKLIDSMLITTVKLKTVFNFILRKTFILNKSGLMRPATIANQIGSIVTLSAGYGSIDLTAGELKAATAVSFISVEWPYENALTVYVAVNNTAMVAFIPKGVLNRTSPDVTYDSVATVTGFYQLNIQYKNNPYKLFVTTAVTAAQYIDYTVTDIRTGITKSIFHRSISDVLMFVKQFWSSTIEIENYWWLNASSVLELSKYDLTLKRKVDGQVDDWYGDRWETVWSRPRHDYIGTEDLYYSVSSAYNSEPMLFKLQAAADNRLVIKYLNPLKIVDVAKPIWTTVNITVTTMPLGTALPHNSTIAAYTKITAASLIACSKISATVVDNVFIIGIAASRGLAQWALRIGGTDALVVIGYGHVGVDGSLTGGEVPSKYCSAAGFTGTVQPISKLPIETYVLPKMIVGTGSTVWFVDESIGDIVTHMTFENGVFNPVTVPLTNKYVETYECAGGESTAVFDVLPLSINIGTLIDQSNVALQFLMTILTPSVIALNPKYVMFGMINQSIGQYAYVWRNSTQHIPNPDQTSSAKGFAKYSMHKSINKSGNESVWVQIIIKGLVGAFDSTIKLSVNSAQNQTATDDSKGRKYSPFFTENVASSVAASLASTGFQITLNSTISGERTLDMFYSISDKTQCYAGPGFVNHNLKAQCVAQSITDLQIDGKKIAFWGVFASLSELLEEFKEYGYTKAAQGLESVISGIGSAPSGVTPGPTIPTGMFVALGLQAAVQVLYGLAALAHIGATAVSKLASVIGGYPEGKAYLQGTVSKRETSVEGTHTYGNKSMALFWPAFGCSTPNSYLDESVLAVNIKDDVEMNFAGGTKVFGTSSQLTGATVSNSSWLGSCRGTIHLVRAALRGDTIDELGTPKAATMLPKDMAVVEGTVSFLDTKPFKNEQVGVSQPAFGPPPVMDYMINNESAWNIGFTALAGEIISVSCDDTKIIDGPPSNIVITNTFCGVASSYTAIEIKKDYDQRYLRPTLVTPDAIGLNINKFNCVHDAKYYHAFDGQSNRITEWKGSAGLDTELLFQQYLFQINDHFKRSSIFPPSQFFGTFNGPPSVAVKSYENVANLVQELTTGVGLENDTPGEQKSLQRFSLPVHSETLSTLPAMVRMLAPYKLHVVEGVTALTTDIRSTQTKYKAPSSIDFNIDGQLFRATDEFICSIEQKAGIVALTDLVAKAGLTFIGSTTKQAYFYSAATKMYYSYAGGKDISKMDILSRFRDLQAGRWDFINQEVIFQCMLENEVLVARLDDTAVVGEVWPPNKTIYNDRSGFKLFSVAGGLTFQGPKRFIVSRFITLDHMLPDIKLNKGRWKRVHREVESPDFTPEVYDRDYGWQYEDWDTLTPLTAVDGWTHDPYLLTTSMLGASEETDGKFEWSLTFAWSAQMDKLFEKDEYVCVNVMAETVTQGGIVRCRPTHIFLYKECFTRMGNAGYYTFKFNSNNGIGNRERLFIWADGFIALEGLALDFKVMSTNRTQPLHTQVDVQNLVEQ